MFSVHIYPNVNHPNLTQVQSVHHSLNAATVAARRWAKHYSFVYVADRDGNQVWQSKALRNNPFSK
jgi:hypothetical protein